MEKKIMQLISHFTVLAVAVWIVASALGKRKELHIKDHPADRRQDPTSTVWMHSNVQGPNAIVGLRGLG